MRLLRWWQERGCSLYRVDTRASRKRSRGPLPGVWGGGVGDSMEPSSMLRVAHQARGPQGFSLGFTRQREYRKPEVGKSWPDLGGTCRKVFQRAAGVALTQAYLYNR